MYLKRQKVPKNWPVKRKGTTYVVRANFNIKNGIPILIILRDLLKIAQIRKEIKKIIHLRYILLNNRPVLKEKNSATLFDILTVVPLKKYYRIELNEKGIFNAVEIKEKDAGNKVAKIINKKMLKGKKPQLNLSDGRNFLSDIKCKVNDSILIDIKNKKIGKCLPLKEKSNAMVFAGKHAGKKGTIEKIDNKEKMVELEVDKQIIRVLIKQIIIIE